MFKTARFFLQMPFCYFPPPHAISSVCVFALNHLPSIHIEAKLLSKTKLFFNDSPNKAWEIESSEKGTMTGMKIILIESSCGIYFHQRGFKWQFVIRGIPAEPPCLRVTEEISTAQSLICWIFQVVQCRVFKLCTSTLQSG